MHLCIYAYFYHHIKSVIHTYKDFSVITCELTLRSYLFYITLVSGGGDFLTMFIRVTETLLLLESRLFSFLFLDQGYRGRYLTMSAQCLTVI